MVLVAEPHVGRADAQGVRGAVLPVVRDLLRLRPRRGDYLEIAPPRRFSLLMILHIALNLMRRTDRNVAEFIRPKTWEPA